MLDFEMALGQLILEHKDDDPSNMIEALDHYIALLEEKAERVLDTRPA